jgi:hypothetical protein
MLLLICKDAHSYEHIKIFLIFLLKEVGSSGK